MSAENMVFRSLYVDPDVDEALKAEAGLLGVSKGVMFRRYLERGIAAPARAPLPEGQLRLRVRTVYLPRETDELLRSQAFDLRISKSDLIRQYLRSAVTPARRAAVVASAQLTAVKRTRSRATAPASR